MKIHVVMAFLTFIPGTLGLHGGGEKLIQGSIRSWGRPAFGLRSSISVEKMPASRGSPFIVSVIVENISGTRVDLKTISAFDLRNSSKTSPESTLTFGSYWCPVNLTDKNPAGKSGLILASPSQLVMEKGTSIRATMDLTRHGWDKSVSSFWPARDFDSVVGPGTYIIRLDIQVGSGDDPKWIRSNEVTAVIGK
ncbi:MAG: hypothetical protein LAP85_27240 [Acidobacteriia bacterium]|nr:hypothetical protein [Terriglobia bacterium]